MLKQQEYSSQTDVLKKQEYLSQLDGLRAIAITLVLLYHWFPENEGINIMANGPLGVTLFFVLSGFLITRILLSGKNHNPSPGLSSLYRRFLIRRILRIFPLYYLVLFLVGIIPFVSFIPGINTRFYAYPFYYILYLSNFLLEKWHDWSDTLSIFWTLAVEEQFYVIWPLIIFGVSKRYLKAVILTAIGLGMASRVVLAFYGYTEGVLMPACLDAFGLGALWAWVLCYGLSPASFLKLLTIAAFPAFALFIYFCLHQESTLVRTLLFRFCMSLFCLYFVARASYQGGFRSVTGFILDHAVVRYIGKISYGLYVYHMLVPALLLPLSIKILHRFFNINLVLTETSGKVTSLLTLIAVASLSHYFYEAPFNRLKRYFKL
jgi:peptidoglycan/LPS O-acetylase OafA/YrhL